LFPSVANVIYALVDLFLSVANVIDALLVLCFYELSSGKVDLFSSATNIIYAQDSVQT
jgi:hypothetical protein